MIDKIDSVVEQLETICDEFDYIADAESNWHVSCRLSFYSEHVNEGIKYLRKMQEYLSTLTEWQLKQLHEGYNYTEEN